MNVKQKKYGFTLVELLTVLAIIALLTGILIPSLTMVRNIAKEAKQKAQLATIEQALMAFRSDYGDYPPSDWYFLDPLGREYCGAQKLAEALLGWDLLGFNKYSKFDLAQTNLLYPTDPALLDASLNERVGPYLELATANAFRLGDLFDDTTPLAVDTFVLCDSFGAKKITIGEKTVKAGTPILYYKADTRGKTTEDIYHYNDNKPLVSPVLTGKKHFPFAVPTPSYFFSNDYITDPKVFKATGRKWPYRADSYILISAGADGLYGTGDDITNFGN